MPLAIPELVAALMTARHFEDAAEQTLRAVLSRARAELGASRFAKTGRLARAAVHLRPGDGYKRLLAIDEGNQRREPDYAPSASAWRWLAERHQPIAIDVNVGTVQALGDGGATVIEAPQANDITKESRHRFLVRDATHVLALPLHAPGGEIVGMIAIEAFCRGAMGQEFIWRTCVADLQLLADIASPSLATLELRPTQAIETDALLPVVGASMVGLIGMLRAFARQNETILIGGPTGAGKSRLARWCHEQSPRRGKPFETLNLLTVPRDLQMAKLVGWMRGAFTGAVGNTPGLISRAEGGTFFIDEIDKLNLDAQAGLLQLLEDHTYTPLGAASGEKTADVRFLVGTNANLQEAVKAGTFREDLYFRINVLPVKLPPLDERADEIVPWAKTMASKLGQPAGTEVVIEEDAQTVLAEQRWPGNLRQLENIVRRAHAIMMVDQPSIPPPSVTIKAAHVRRAIEIEGSGTRRGTVELLVEAASSFVEDAKRRADRKSGAIDLDHADAFRGFVLGVAARQLGREAYRLFGKDALVENRNHHRALKRELDKVEKLCKELDAPFPFADLDKPDD